MLHMVDDKSHKITYLICEDFYPPGPMPIKEERLIILREFGLRPDVADNHKCRFCERYSMHDLRWKVCDNCEFCRDCAIRHDDQCMYCREIIEDEYLDD